MRANQIRQSRRVLLFQKYAILFTVEDDILFLDGLVDQRSNYKPV